MVDGLMIIYRAKGYVGMQRGTMEEGSYEKLHKKR